MFKHIKDSPIKVNT